MMRNTGKELAVGQCSCGRTIEKIVAGPFIFGAVAGIIHQHLT
jgi:hypothetical protein